MEMHIRDARRLQTINQKKIIMGRPEIDGRCRRHPEHRQSKGVCPFCLRERLSQLSASSSATTTLANSSAAATSSSNSNLSSAATSPPNRVPNNTSRLLKPGLLKKSRSLAFVIGRPREEDQGKKKKEEGKREKEKEKKRKKKGGFWSKLVIGSDRRKEVDGNMLHSRTMKEKAADKWALF